MGTERRGTGDYMKWRTLFVVWYVIGLCLMLFYHIPKSLQFSSGWFLIFYALSVLELEAVRLRSRLTLFFCAIIIGFLTFFLEAFGTRTGFPFGSYHYLSTLGFLYFHVPYTMAFAWVGVLTNATLISTQHSKWTRAFEVAIWVVILDLVLDPVAFMHHFWVWDTSGAYYGVPIENYLGWFGAAFVLSLLFPLKVVPMKERVWAGRIFEMMLVMFGLLAVKSEVYSLFFITLLGIFLIEGKAKRDLRREEQLV